MIFIKALTVPPNRFDRVSQEEFAKWKDESKAFSSEYIAWNEKGRFGKFTYQYLETNKATKKSVQKTRSFSLDQRNGNLFFDASATAVGVKFFFNLLKLPVLLVAKTIYHIALFGTFRAILHYRMGDIGKEEAKVRIIRSIADGIRTPVYGLAMLSLSFVGIFAEQVLEEGAFQVRDLYGRIENHLNWGEKSWNQIHTSAPCMQPKRNAGLLGSEKAAFETKLKKVVEKIRTPGETITFIPK